MCQNSSLNPGDPLLDSDDVSRYCKPNDYDLRRREPRLRAFQRRKSSEVDLSINRLQHFQTQSLTSAIECVRQEFRLINYGLSKNGRFVVFNVEAAKSKASNNGYEIRFIYSPDPPVFSHSSICDIPIDPNAERAVATAMKRLIKISHTFEAVPE